MPVHPEEASVHPILRPENLLDLGVAGLCAAIGAAVLVARPKNSVNVYFAAFMGFLAWGMFAGVLHIHATQDVVAAQEGGPGAMDPAEAQMHFARSERIFWIPYIFDPLTLLYFASIYPRRNWLHRRRVLLPFAGVALTLLAITVFAPLRVPDTLHIGEHLGPFSTATGRVVVAAYMLGAYLLALGGLAPEAWSPTGVTRQRARLLLVGLGVAVFSRIGLMVEELFLIITRPPDLTPEPAVFLALRVVATLVALLIALAFHLAVARRAPPAERASLREVRAATIFTLGALAIVVWLPQPLAIGFGIETGAAAQTLSLLERVRYSARWLIFGSVVGYSILRFQLFDLSYRARRAVLHASVAGAILGVLGVLALVLEPALSRMGPALLLVAVAGASILVLASYEGAKRRLGRHLRAPDPEEVRARKVDVYRAALEAGSTHEELARLRVELSLTDDEARAVELVSRAPRGGPLVPGTMVAGRYEVQRLLARGGGGRIFLARDKLLDRLVVLKSVWEGGTSAEVERALHEAKLAGGLSHPNVVIVHDVVRWGAQQLVVMEYVPGGSIADALRERGPYAPSDAVALARGILAGLAAVHERGIVHGDVKAANVLLASDGAPKLGDFGISAVQRVGTITVAAPQESPRGLTLRYAAPEVLRGEAPTSASDVYSCALLLCELLAPQPATGGADAWARAAAERVPPAVAATLRRATEADPTQRFRDARAFLDALEESLALRA